MLKKCLKITKKVPSFHSVENSMDLFFFKGKKYQKFFGMSWVIYKTLTGKGCEI